MSNNILLVSPFFYPEIISTGKYNSSLVKELTKSSEVSVICLHPFYPDWKMRKSNDQLEGVKIFRGGAYLRFTSNPIIRRFILEIGFSIYSLWKYSRSKNQYETIIGILPPSMFYFFLLKLIPSRTKKIAIVHDLQSVYAGQQGGIIRKVIAGMSKYVERVVLSSMDKVIYLSESMKRKASKEFSISIENSFVAYPFINTPIWDGDTSNLNEVLSDSAYNVVYSGAFSDKQNPDKLIELFNKITENRDDVICHIFSSGPLHIKKKSENLNSKVRFHNLVSVEDVPELYARSTIQIVPQIEGSSEASLPSKLPNLLQSGCPIFLITDQNSEIGEILNEMPAAKVQYKWDISKLSESLLDFLEEYKGVKKQDTLNSRIQNETFGLFSIKTLCEKILDK